MGRVYLAAQRAVPLSLSKKKRAGVAAGPPTRVPRVRLYCLSRSAALVFNREERDAGCRFLLLLRGNWNGKGERDENSMCARRGRRLVKQMRDERISY